MSKEAFARAPEQEEPDVVKVCVCALRLLTLNKSEGR